MKFIMLTTLVLTLNGCALVAIEGQGSKAGGDTVLVCHKGKKTMELPREAAGAHINHGDTYGPC